MQRRGSQKSLFYIVFLLIYALTYGKIVIKRALTSTIINKINARGVQILLCKILAFLNCEF